MLSKNTIDWTLVFQTNGKFAGCLSSAILYGRSCWVERTSVFFGDALEMLDEWLERNVLQARVGVGCISCKQVNEDDEHRKLYAMSPRTEFIEKLSFLTHSKMNLRAPGINNH